jgi:creatinine amidohydrolase
MGAIHLNDSPWTRVDQTQLLLIPVGSTEQHGPHLPFCVDTLIATSVATEVADRISRQHGVRVVVAPALAFGASGEHKDFPGTLSIGHEALQLILIELIRSASLWAGKTVFINGHGGNVHTMSQVIATMSAEGHKVAWVPCALESSTDAHAGFDETSVALVLAPELVDMNQARPGNIQPLAEILPRLMAEGIRPVTESGVLGDPTSANASDGRKLLEELVTLVTARVLND